MPIPPSSNSAAGFSLIELLVVLTVMGLLMALAVPVIGGNSDGLARRQAVAKLRTALGDARSAAIRTGHPVQLPLASIDAQASFAVAGGGSGGPGPTFFADGSSSGGTILLESKPVLQIEWLTGGTRDAR